jgi:hypothetical protein
VYKANLAARGCFPLIDDLVVLGDEDGRRQTADHARLRGMIRGLRLVERDETKETRRRQQQDETPSPNQQREICGQRGASIGEKEREKDREKETKAESDRGRLCVYGEMNVCVTYVEWKDAQHGAERDFVEVNRVSRRGLDLGQLLR